MSKVYFIQDMRTGAVKIGVSADPAQRLRQLQTGTSNRLCIIRALDGDDRAERWLHKKFATHHIRGEWFGFCDEMMNVQLPWFAERSNKKPRDHGSGSVVEYVRNAHRLGLLSSRDIEDWRAAGVIV
ncbi:MAG: GIY-YIG nuclease family protein [Beijerinckiaceae bacterium]